MSAMTAAAAASISAKVADLLDYAMPRLIAEGHDVIAGLVALGQTIDELAAKDGVEGVDGQALVVAALVAKIASRPDAVAAAVAKVLAA